MAAGATRDQWADRTSYAILITPRSGSTFLAHELRASDCLGFPDEWFNPDAIVPVLALDGLDRFSDYARFLYKRYTSACGVFGVQIASPHLDNLMQMASVEAVLGPATTWFMLRRRNLVAQAVSLAIALRTGVWQTVQRGLDSDAAAPTITDEEVISAARSIVSQEVALYTFMRSRGQWPIELTFEDVVADPQRALNLFANALRVTPASDEPRAAKNPIGRVGSQVNTELEDRVRETQHRQLQVLLEKRPPLLERRPAI